MCLSICRSAHSTMYTFVDLSGNFAICILAHFLTMCTYSVRSSFRLHADLSVFRFLYPTMYTFLDSLDNFSIYLPSCLSVNTHLGCASRFPCVNTSVLRSVYLSNPLSVCSSNCVCVQLLICLLARPFFHPC